MSLRVLAWVVAAPVSVGVHAALAAGLVASLSPKPPPDQSLPETRFDMQTMQVAARRASPEAPESLPAPEAEGEGRAVGQAGIPRREAANAPLRQSSVPPEPSDGTPAEAAPVNPRAAEPAAAPMATGATVAVASTALRPQAPAVRSEAASLAPRAAPLPEVNALTVAAAATPIAPSQAASLPPPSATQPQLEVGGDAAPTSTPEAAALPSVEAASARAATVAATAQSATALDAPRAAATPFRPTSAPVAQAAVPLTSVGLDTAPPAPAPLVVAAPDTAVEANAAPRPAEAARPDAANLGASRPTATTAAAAEPDQTAITAALAFTGDGPADPVSVAAVQSFVQPGGTQGSGARDGIAGLLGGVACARLQATFEPESGTLKVTGHIPDAARRAPILTGLQSLMGQSIGVTDNMLILPSPQCDALAGIEALGLPQSTDQFTNPLVVGDDTHARAYRFVTDERLILDVSAADYPAYLYVDYFDAAGQVIHLSPNDVAPLRLILPGETARIGAPGTASLDVRIGPPYGQEIAVAFAASVPLHAGERPVVEPAAEYLEWLRDRIADARAEDPEFKGEWVYFFVTTTER